MHPLNSEGSVVSAAVEKRMPVWLEINLGRLKHNLGFLRSQLNPGTGVLAVVKTNAYGHGMLHSARSLEPQVDYFGVSDIAEATTLRDSGILKPILIFGFVAAQDVSQVLKYDLTISLSDLAHAEELHQVLLSQEAGRKLKVHLKIDTGMGRLGFSHRTAFEDILKTQSFFTLELEGIFTHFAVADDKTNPFTQEQLTRFEALLRRWEREGLNFRWRHSAGSGGLLNFKTSHFNLVRPGLALYGLYENHESTHELEPVLSWKTRVKLIKDLEPGDTVSYNRRFSAQTPTRIAVLPVGYGHGYPLALSSKAQVVIRGKLYPVAGQVCMDYTIVEIGLSEEIQEEDEVILIGASGNARVTVNQLARLAGTIPYEIVTRLSPSLPRVYIES